MDRKNTDAPTRNISRRRFLKLTGATAGGLIVVGSGLSGSGPRASLAQTAAATVAATKIPLKGKKVGLSSPIEVEILNEFYADMKKEAAQPENQIDLVVVDAKGDAVKQSGDLEAFIAQGYDGIFFLALAPGGLD